MTDLHKLSDLELLELAAEAGGISVIGGYTDFVPGDMYHYRDCEPGIQLAESGPDGGNVWNSLRNDGDALRLAVVVGISFKYERNAPPELGLPRECAVASVDGRWYSAAPVNFDEVAATCRAITIAAAAVALAKRASLEPAC